jgi:CheY-like chemotaxis protein
MHGGQVRAESPGLGKGSTFTINLPVSISVGLGDVRMTGLGESIADETLINAPMALDGIRVLIVDDEVDAREFLSAMLSQHGAVAKLAASASEALAIISQSKPTELPDVLVSDIGMPNQDGYALIRKVRALPPEKGGNISAVALTAYARFEDRMRALAAGFQMHIAKPIEPAELVMVIKSLTARAAGSGD